MALHVPLDRLQRWMQAVVVDPGPEHEASGAPPASPGGRSATTWRGWS